MTDRRRSVLRRATPSGTCAAPPPARPLHDASREAVLWTTKAATLAWLAPRLARATVPPFLWFTVRAWREGRGQVLRRIARELPRGPLAVRSATRREEREGASLAGHYRTCLQVARQPAALAHAIDAVVRSYDGGEDDEVLVQEMVTDPVRSGVVLTRDTATGVPYVTLELSDGSDTAAVTGGRGGAWRVRVHPAASPLDVARANVARLLGAVREIERCVPAAAALDVEVAETRGGDVALLQVRRLVVARDPARDARAAAGLRGAALAVARLGRPRSDVAGTSTVLGLMPDWNPGELIGAHPSPLAAAIFRVLVSDRVWHRARRRMGYQPLSGVPLVHLIAGRPFVDTRASFNSFLPAGLPWAVRTALVDAWLDRLRSHPELHDRVELDVAQTVFDFGLHATHRERFGRLLSASAYQRWSDGLRALTARAVTTSPHGSLQRAVARIATLGPTRLGVARRSRAALGPMVLGLLRRCREDGALPFAIVARHGFIAEALLRSLVARGALAPERAQQLRDGLPTSAGALARDWRRVARGTLPRREFRDRYGHLRPGTFDVTSLPYALRLDTGWPEETVPSPPERAPFVPTAREIRAIDILLGETRLGVRADELLAWAAAAIVGRDHAKFLLSRGLSVTLEHLAAWGETLGLTRDDLAQLTLRDLAGPLASGSGVDAAHLAALAARARARAADERLLRICHLLRRASDLYVAVEPPTVPTFVTARTVAAAPVALDGHALEIAPVRGRIVCLESADPGFDWILVRGIAGLVTCFGGANSHMALRCGELGVPAALGVGPVAFGRLGGAPLVELRCGERAVRVLAVPS